MHAAHSDPDPVAGEMRRLRRRGHIATGIGSAGYISTLIAAITDSDPRDGDVITGLEVAFLLIAFGGFLVAFSIWYLTQSADHAMRIWNLRNRAAQLNAERAAAVASRVPSARRDALR